MLMKNYILYENQALKFSQSLLLFQQMFIIQCKINNYLMCPEGIK